jgi:hypothetical protein
MPVNGGEAQGPLRGRQRDVHDRRIEHDHELGEADGAQDEPPARIGGGAALPCSPRDMNSHDLSFPVDPFTVKTGHRATM